MGYERFLSDRVAELTGTRKVSRRGQKWSGGLSPDEAMKRAEAEFAAMSDDEKDDWTRRANADHVRGPEDRARQGAYRREMNSALGGRAQSAGGASLAMAPSRSDGGPGFSGVAGAGRNSPIQLRTPDQVRARVGNSLVHDDLADSAARQKATGDAIRARNAHPAEQVAAYRANVNPDGTLKTGQYQAPTTPAPAPRLGGAIAATSPAGRSLAGSFDGPSPAPGATAPARSLNIVRNATGEATKAARLAGGNRAIAATDPSKRLTGAYAAGVQRN